MAVAWAEVPKKPRAPEDIGNSWDKDAGSRRVHRFHRGEAQGETQSQREG